MSDTVLPLIPSEWQLAIQQLDEWRHGTPLTTQQWDVMVNWLTQSSFGDKSYMAGELGAQLIHDLGSNEVLDQFLSRMSDDSWVIHFQNIAANGRQHSRRSALIAIACEDSNWVVQSYAISVRNTLSLEVSKQYANPVVDVFQGDDVQPLDVSNAPKFIITSAIHVIDPTPMSEPRDGEIKKLDDRVSPLEPRDATPGPRQGTIRKLTDKGCGFISIGGSKDLFFHSKSLQGVRFEELHEGQRVTYVGGQGQTGPCAENVKPV